MQKNIKKVITALISTLWLHGNLVEAANISNASNPVKFFTGRAEALENLGSELNKKNIVLVSGIAGIGKTELVRQFIYQNKDQYDLIWTVDCARKIEDEFAILRDEINHKLCASGSCRIQVNPTNIAGLTLKFLTQSNLKWLLIFDNWNDATSIEYLPALSDLKKMQHCIVISRKNIDNIHYIGLDFLDEKASIAFLKKFLPSYSDSDLSKMYHAFNGYPILMFQAASYLNIQKHLSVEEFIDLHKSQSGVINSGNTQDGFMKLIMQECSNDIDKKLLSAFTILDNHGIDKTLLNELFANDNRAEYLRALDNLIKFNLIKVKQEENRMEFNMHDFLREKFKENIGQKIHQETLQDIVKKVNVYLGNNWVDIVEKLESNKNLKSNLAALLVALNDENIFDLESIKFRTKMGLVFFAYLDYKNTKLVLNQAKEHLSVLEDEEDLDSLLALINFYYCNAMYLEFTGEDFRLAITQFAKALELAEISKDQEMIYVINCMLAQIKIYSGDLKKAEEYILSAEKILNSGLKPKNDGIFIFVKSKIWMEKGLYKEALELADMELSKTEKNPEEKVGVFDATAYLLKAEILTRQEKYKEALELLNNKVDKTLKALDPDHELRGRILNIYSLANLGVGKTDLSLKQIEESLLILKKSCNVDSYEMSDDEDIGVALKIKGDILLAIKLYNEAIESYKLSLKVQENRYGSYQTDFSSMTILGIVKAYWANKDFLLANEYISKHEDIYSPSHLRTKEMYKIKLYSKSAA